ncbi:DUF4232 domain-containing protein [Streptomyces sp. ISL-44]|uniref:DUF4232 domain-containing protein n=1 Tax=Streptomyces sp. ISL-44 TaxID=2819184 RepID=UPI001BE914DC|nr:DUF4232 domain-containing protein [Streptomyces sp. ISL-44]MBT2546664.1 DUF4232 domain-containing protein [Streptomyces sp. ISL-44]
MTALSRSRAVATALLPLVVLGLTACADVGAGGQATGGKAPSGTGSAAPATSGVPAKSAEVDGNAKPCSMHTLTYTLKTLDQPAGHVLITAVNSSGLPCRMPTEVPIVTFKEHPHDADVIGPEAGAGPVLAPGARAYAGLVLTGPGGETDRGHIVTVANIRLGFSTGSKAAPIEGGPVTLRSARTTVWSTTEKAALTY